MSWHRSSGFCTVAIVVLALLTATPALGQVAGIDRDLLPLGGPLERRRHHGAAGQNQLGAALLEEPLGHGHAIGLDE